MKAPSHEEVLGLIEALVDSAWRAGLLESELTMREAVYANALRNIIEELTKEVQCF